MIGVGRSAFVTYFRFHRVFPLFSSGYMKVSYILFKIPCASEAGNSTKQTHCGSCLGCVFEGGRLCSVENAKLFVPVVPNEAQS